MAIEHPRFGYRRIHALLNREDFKVNLKRVYRLWKQESLSLPKKRPRKPRAKATVGIVPQATRANQVWTYDFVFDQSLSGKSLKMLTLIDQYTQDVFGGRGWSVHQKRTSQTDIAKNLCGHWQPGAVEIG